METHLIEVSELMSEGACCEPAQPRLDEATAQQITDDLQILAHPIRLQILDILSQCEGQLCVCDIESALPIKQPTVSHHLKLLRAAGLIDCEKRGLYVHYFIKRQTVQSLWARVKANLEGVI